MSLKHYIGDGVYVYVDRSLGTLVLETSDGLRTTNRIVLEREVFENLEQYVAAMRAKGKEEVDDRNRA